MDFSNLDFMTRISLKYKYMSEKQILNYIDELVNYLNINAYLNNVRFTNKGTFDVLSYYNIYDKSLNINLNNIKNMQKRYMYSYSYLNKCNTNLFINSGIIIGVIHELIHAYQIYLVKNNMTFLKNQFNAEFKYTDINDAGYYDNYELFVFERQALCNSLNNFLNILTKYYPKEKEIFKFYLDELDYYLTYGYEKDENGNTIYPNKILNEKILNIKDEKYDSHDYYNNMMLGFNIDIDLYSKDKLRKKIKNIN